MHRRDVLAISALGLGLAAANTQGEDEKPNTTATSVPALGAWTLHTDPAAGQDDKRFLLIDTIRQWYSVENKGPDSVYVSIGDTEFELKSGQTETKNTSQLVIHTKSGKKASGTFGRVDTRGWSFAKGEGAVIQDGDIREKLRIKTSARIKVTVEDQANQNSAQTFDIEGEADIGGKKITLLAEYGAANGTWTRMSN